MMRQAIRQNGLLLGLFALVTTALIAATQLSTKDRIAEQIRMAREAALLEIVPRQRHDNQMLEFTLAVDDNDHLHLKTQQSIFVATQTHENHTIPVALIIPSIAPDGYSGAIHLLVGVNVDGSVAGVRVIEHKETPGLGDKVELRKSPWVLGFNGRSLNKPTANKWTVKRDKGEFDQFTGATITPRAVTLSVARTLHYFEINKEALLKEINDVIKMGRTTPSDTQENNQRG